MPPSAVRDDVRSTARSRSVRAAGTVLLLLALLVAGCVPTTGTADPQPATAPSDPATDRPAEDDARSDPGCDDDLGPLDAIITDQLAAFSSGDWQQAWALTSQEFRASGVDAAGLREIVLSGYAEAADATDHEVLGCVVAGDDAQVLIDITASDGATLQLVYLLTREDGRWRISGAVEHDVGGSEPPTIET